MADDSWGRPSSSFSREAYIADKPASFARKLQYGLSASTWLGGELYRMGKAKLQPGDYRENIQRLEAKRLEGLKERYPDITPEDTSSVASLIGEGIGLMADPAMFGTMYLAAPAKGAAYSRLALRARSAGLFGAEGALRAATYHSSRGQDIEPTNVLLSGTLGGTLGALFPMVGQRQALGPAKKEAESVSRTTDPIRDHVGISYKDVNQVTPFQALQKYRQEMRPTLIDPPLSPAKEKAIHDSLLLARGHPDMPKSLLENLRDIPNNNEIPARLKAFDDMIEKEKLRRANKEVGALSDKEFNLLRKERARLYKEKKGLGYNIADQVIDISEGANAGISQLSADGLLSATSIRRAIIRPIIGAAGGYGTGATANLFTEEDNLNPIMFALIGASGGALSSKIVNSTFSPLIKQAGKKAVKDTIKNSIWAHANVLFSSTMATRANAFGGRLELFSRMLFNQLGADARGASKVALETQSSLLSQEINTTRRQLLQKQRLGDTDISLLGYNKDIVRYREVVGKYRRGLYGERGTPQAIEGLKRAGFNDEEIEMIRVVSKGTKDQLDKMANEVTAVLPEFKMLDDYGLPQFHNHAKIVKNEGAAREAYDRAFIEQAKANLKPGESFTPAMKAKALAASKKHIDAIIRTGSPGNKVGGQWAGTDYTSPNMRMRPLIDNFELDRTFKDIKAVKEIEEFMLWDVEEVMSRYVESTIPSLSFARTFGGNGEVITSMKAAINRDFKKAMDEASSPAEQRSLQSLLNKQMKTIHDMVDAYHGRLHAAHRITSNNIANNVYAVSTTLANLTYLPKVVISSLGDLVQPFQNSGVFSAIKGLGRTSSNKGFHKDGFGDVGVLEHELQAYSMKNNPGSTIQSAAYAANQMWFKINGLGSLTGFARRFAYNTGIEEGFKIASQLGKSTSRSLKARANNLGISNDVANYLNKFKTVDEAWKDTTAKTYLNRIGVKSADRDALIPQIGNRRGFSQSKNPAIRATGQFLSWAQAKSAQTNTLVNRMESGDAALAVRMLGSLVIYDGILTFRDFLNDPTGKRLDRKGVESYTESFTRLETIGRAGEFSGNLTPWYIGKAAQLMSTNTAYNPVSNIAPSLGWMWDMATGFSPVPFKGSVGTVWSNLADDDPEGALVQVLDRVPLGKEIMALRAGITGDELIDMPKRRGRAKGGVVKNVPQVPREPDERIDKMTGLPYNVQAGTAFIDEEDEEKREDFVFGGIASRIASLLKFEPGKLIPKAASVRDYTPSAKVLENLKRSNPAVVKTSSFEISDAGKDLERLQASKDLSPDSPEWYDRLSIPVLWKAPKQVLTSADTSINLKKLPAAFTKLIKEDTFKAIRTGLDIGGGKANNVVNKLKDEFGFNLRVYDPFNRSPKHNAEVISQIIEEGGVDSVFSNNTLNVIREKENQLRIVQQARDVLRDNKTAYFSVYEGNKSGVGKMTTKGWQEHKPLSMYKEIIEEVFDAANVTIKNGVIRAVKKTGTPY